jgi:nucleotide-binding universal stress UspA family protein
MEKAKRVLVAIKTAEQVDDLINLACCVTAPDSSLSIIHVIELPPVTPLDVEIPDMQASAEKILSAAEEASRQCGLKARVEILRARSAADALLDEMKEHGVELVIIGHHHRSRMVESLIGTTSSRFAERARCRVLISIPPRA